MKIKIEEQYGRVMNVRDFMMIFGIATLISIGYWWIKTNDYPYEANPDKILIIFVVGIVLLVLNLIWNYLYMRSLTYEFDEKENTLKEGYKIITEKIYSYRLFMIRRMDIEQGWIEKFFGLYSVGIIYGPGENLTLAVVRGLSKNTAETLVSKIKPMGTNIVIR